MLGNQQRNKLRHTNDISKVSWSKTSKFFFLEDETRNYFSVNIYSVIGIVASRRNEHSLCMHYCTHQYFFCSHHHIPQGSSFPSPHPVTPTLRSAQGHGSRSNPLSHSQSSHRQAQNYHIPHLSFVDSVHSHK
jgi:hypothetical protein